MESATIERLAEFEKEKGVANEYFKKGDLKSAKAAFEGLINKLSSALKEPQTDLEYYAKVKLLFIQVTSNKVLANFKLNEIDECLASCEQVLKMDPTHAKCMYRRALCQLLKGDKAAEAKNFTAQLEYYGKGKSDLEMLHRLEPSNKEVENKLSAVVRVIIQLQQKLKDDPASQSAVKASKGEPKKRSLVVEEENPQPTETKKVRLPVGLSKEKLENVTHAAVAQITNDLLTSKDLPSSVSIFELNIQSFKKNIENLFRYLKKIPLEHFHKLYQTGELNPDLLLLIVKALHDSGKKDEPDFCFELLMTIAETNKFYIVVKQLIKSEKKQIRSLLDEILDRVSVQDKEQKYRTLLERYACKDV